MHEIHVDVLSCIRILKSMVHGWIRDVTQYHNVFADHQIIHFYRWLRSPAALLYDPALRRTLHNLMKKLFMQLVAEFKRLGSTVVHANFNRLILSTKKKRLLDALAYVEYITNAIRSRELFHMIDISYNQCWLFLFWMDQANHGGVKGKLPSSALHQDPTTVDTQQERKGEDEDEEGESDGEEPTSTPKNDGEELNQSDQEDDEDSPDVEMNWNLAQFLPEAGACQTNFNMMVAGYILAVHQHLEEEQHRVTPGSTPVRRRGQSSQTQAPSFNTHASPDTVEHCQKLISEDMCQQMFSITQKIQKKLSGSLGRASDLSTEFPSLPGSHLPLRNPALEFVKAVCQVLSLDKNITNQVRKMKRDLLKLIGVGEFSEDAQFVDPCLSYVLPEVICKSCNHIRDLDLCRDPYLSQEGNQGALWSCAQCKTEYDVEEIEQALITSVQRKAMAYVLQDLHCMKCKGIKEMNLSRYCTCAGDFDTTQSYEEIAQKLKTFKNIARHYHMDLLLETVDWILQMNPQCP